MYYRIYTFVINKTWWSGMPCSFCPKCEMFLYHSDGLSDTLLRFCLLHFMVWQYILVGSSVPGCRYCVFLVVLSMHIFVFSSLIEPCTGCAAPYGFRNIMSLSNNANRFSVSHVVFWLLTLMATLITKIKTLFSV